MTTAFRTPGVYVVEKNAFPNSVVEVPTAVPAFVGYTEQARWGTTDLTGTPVRLASMREYEAVFGRPPITELAFAAGGDGSSGKLAFAYAENRHLLYHSMRMFFDNGGGPCYVVSVGTYGSGIAGDKLWNADIGDALKRELEPTMIVIPEAAQLPPEQWQGVAKAVLQHCAEMQSRITILDVPQVDNENTTATNNAARIAEDAGHLRAVTGDRLGFGVAYYPWLNTTVIPDSDIDFRSLKPEARETLLAQIGRDEDELVARLAGQPQAGAAEARAGLVKQRCETIRAFGHGASAASGNGQAARIAAGDETEAREDTRGTEVGEAGTSDGEGSGDAPQAAGTVRKAPAKQGDKAGAMLKDRDVAKLLPGADGVALTETGQLGAVAAYTPLPADTLAAHRALLGASDRYRAVMAALRTPLNVFPPSGAMAGVYARTDNTFGVFKAPANTGLVSAVSPTRSITNDEQADLNAPLDGKAINAIRAIPGRGLVVWGARTLDGNSQDWRYVNVRRTMIMLEQSIMAAVQAYVFEPNTMSTWVTVRAMVVNYLTNKWRDGALMGATPDQAFAVDVGLGSTMSASDVLDGVMRVSVKVAIVRPAEFIELTFVQTMQQVA